VSPKSIFDELGPALKPYNPAIAAAQVVGVGMVGGAAVFGGVATAPLLKGPVLATFMQVTETMSGHAAVQAGVLSQEALLEETLVGGAYDALVTSSERAAASLLEAQQWATRFGF
jgi:hypothetical protein